MGAGERGVAAEIDFAAGREPAQIVTVLISCSALDQEGCLGVVHLDGDGLHPLVSPLMGGGAGRTQMPAGFPWYGSAVKASTTAMGWDMD